MLDDFFDGLSANSYPTSSSHTWWESVFGNLTSIPRKMFQGFNDRSSQGMTGCLGYQGSAQFWGHEVGGYVSKTRPPHKTKSQPWLVKWTIIISTRKNDPLPESTNKLGFLFFPCFFRGFRWKLNATNGVLPVWCSGLSKDPKNTVNGRIGMDITSRWFQALWKICVSNWISPPGVKITFFETTT